MTRRLLFFVGAGAAVAATIIVYLLAFPGASEATDQGKLNLDWEISDNTPISVGVVQECLSTTASSVEIDVIAQGAVDWQSAAYRVNYPMGTLVTDPGPSIIDAGWDFDAINDFPQNFLNPGTDPFSDPDGALFGLTTDVAATEIVPDGDGSFGISYVDDDGPSDTLTEGALVRITLDISGLADGTHTISMGVDGFFPGVVHSDGTTVSGLAFPADVDPASLGSATLAKGVACGTGTPTPIPTSTATVAPAATATAPPSDMLPTGGTAPGSSDGNGWLTVVYLTAGGIAAAVAVGAIAWRLRRWARNK